MNNSQTIQLSDSRLLGYAEYGPPTGVPLFYFHGYPGSRLEAVIVEPESKDLNAHLIAIDRPGMGLSDYQNKRRILDFPRDVQELAAHLQLTNYGVLGVSGGGPYALACAHQIPSSILTGCAIVSGSGPYYLTKDGLDRGEKTILSIARNFPWIFRFLLWLQLGRNVNDMDWWKKNYRKLGAKLPKSDEEVFRNKHVEESIITKSVEAFRQGGKGLVTDFKLYSEDWGFKLSEIPFETEVSIFHGEMDRNVPVSIARFLSSKIPNCRTRFYHDEGHLSVLKNRFGAIIEALHPHTSHH
ncbi:alpha/beta hydrolase [Candidatus Bathyarchaeota archaeon]|nr:alpha/beta hydrolase [Candidatus Bathyarchaeota archaeon]